MHVCVLFMSIVVIHDYEHFYGVSRPIVALSVYKTIPLYILRIVVLCFKPSVTVLFFYLCTLFLLPPRITLPVHLPPLVASILPSSSTRYPQLSRIILSWCPCIQNMLTPWTLRPLPRCFFVPNCIIHSIRFVSVNFWLGAAHRCFNCFNLLVCLYC